MYFELSVGGREGELAWDRVRAAMGESLRGSGVRRRVCGSKGRGWRLVTAGTRKLTVYFHTMSLPGRIDSELWRFRR